MQWLCENNWCQALTEESSVLIKEALGRHYYICPKCGTKNELVVVDQRLGLPVYGTLNEVKRNE